MNDPLTIAQQPAIKLSHILTPVESPTPMAHHTLKIIRSYSAPDGSPAIEAVMLNGDRVTVWSGAPPDVEPSLHPVLPRTLGQGQGADGPCWVEHRPGPWTLSSIRGDIDRAAAIHITAHLADGLAALHARSRVHGSIELNSVVLSPSGTPFFIGAGRSAGSPEADVDALLSLLEQLTDTPALEPRPRTAAALAAKLREHVGTPPSIAPWLASQPTEDIGSADELILQLIPMGFLDEVQPDIGMDSVGTGLLDRWKPAMSDEDLTDDPTETVDFQSVHTQSRQQLLSELLLTLDRVVESDPSSPAVSDLRRHLTTETLDPIPTLNGLPHGPIHNPVGHAERTADVSIPEVTRPTTDSIEETTGVTGSESAGQHFFTRLLLTAVLGMAGAAVVLLIWILIGDVF